MTIHADLLIDYFSIPVRRAVTKKFPQTQEYIDSEGRLAFVERVSNREWEGWFKGDHSMTYSAPTKRELLADMGLVKKCK